VENILKPLLPGLNGQVLKLRLKLQPEPVYTLKVTGPAVEVETLDEVGEPEYGWEYPVELIKTETNEK